MKYRFLFSVALLLAACGEDRPPLAPTAAPTPAAKLIDDIGLGGIGTGGGGRVLIGFKNLPDPALITSLGGTVIRTYHLVPAIAATLSDAQVGILSANPAVAYVERDLKVRALQSAEQTRPWGVQQIGAGREHEGGNRGRGVRIGLIDTGIDYAHPDLDGNFAGGYDFVNDDPDPMDDHGHGTLSAGIIAAEADGQGALGVAPEARLFALKVLDAAGDGFVSDVVAAVEWCRDHGIQVTNNGYGGQEDLGRTLESAFDRSASAGLIHVGAAGNDGRAEPGRTNVVFPARFPALIAVGATDRQDQRVWFSNTGPEVELAAPGVGIYTDQLGGGYWWTSGTSTSCALVSGAVALLLAKGVTNPRSQLRLLTKDLGPAGRDPEYGYGRIRLGEEAGGPPPSPPPAGTLVIWDGEGGSVAGSRFHFGDANSDQAFAGAWCFEGRPTPWHEPGIGLNGVKSWRTDISGFREITFYAKADGTGKTFAFSIYAWPHRSKRVNIDRYIEGGKLDTRYRLVRIPLSVLKTDQYGLDKVEILYFGTAEPRDVHRIFIDEIQVR